MLSGNVNIAAAVLDDDEEDDPDSDEEYEDEDDVLGDEEMKTKKKAKRRKSKKRDVENNADDLRKQHNIEDDHLKSYKKSTWVNFHAIMIVGSIYMSMILTNWGA